MYKTFQEYQGVLFYIEARLEATSRVQYLVLCMCIHLPLVNKLKNTITSTYATSTVPLQILYKQQSNNSTEQLN